MRSARWALFYLEWSWPALRGGRDIIDHRAAGHDDLVNSAAGALVLANRRPKAERVPLRRRPPRRHLRKMKRSERNINALRSALHHQPNNPTLLTRRDDHQGEAFLQRAHDQFADLAFATGEGAVFAAIVEHEADEIAEAIEHHLCDPAGERLLVFLARRLVAGAMDGVVRQRPVVTPMCRRSGPC